MPRRSSPARTGQAANAEENTANAFAKEVNVLLKLLADKSGKYKQLSVELVKALKLCCFIKALSTLFISFSAHRIAARM